ncbi:unnamed protein product, partial [Phaeothamnion confervicola]
EDPIKEISALQLLGAAGSHPNVLAAQEALQDDGAVYLVTSYCGGGELHDFILGRTLAENEARPLFRQLAEGVAFLQSEDVRICHRDLSPENVLLRDDGAGDSEDLVIMDFGLALRVPVDREGRPAVVASGGAVGKLHYMSPEVLTNQPFNGFSVDVWACGVILFM